MSTIPPGSVSKKNTNTLCDQFQSALTELHCGNKDPLTALFARIYKDLEGKKTNTAAPALSREIATIELAFHGGAKIGDETSARLSSLISKVDSLSALNLGNPPPKQATIMAERLITKPRSLLAKLMDHANSISSPNEKSLFLKDLQGRLAASKKEIASCRTILEDSNALSTHKLAEAEADKKSAAAIATSTAKPTIEDNLAKLNECLDNITRQCNDQIRIAKELADPKEKSSFCEHTLAQMNSIETFLTRNEIEIGNRLPAIRTAPAAAVVANSAAPAAAAPAATPQPTAAPPAAAAAVVPSIDISALGDESFVPADEPDDADKKETHADKTAKNEIDAKQKAAIRQLENDKALVRELEQNFTPAATLTSAILKTSSESDPDTALSELQSFYQKMKSLKKLIEESE